MTAHCREAALPASAPPSTPACGDETAGVAAASRLISRGGPSVFTSLARTLPSSAAVLPWRQSRLPFPRPRKTGDPFGGHRLDLKSFTALLRAEGLAERLPDLADRVRALAHSARILYGFSFAPSELRIPTRDLPWLLAGLASGLTCRPLVVDSPRPADVAALGLDPHQPMLAYRLERLRASGMRILNPSAGAALAAEYRWPERGSLADALGDNGLQHLPEVYERLPPARTIGGRVGAGPRLVLVGQYLGPRRGPLLATGTAGSARVEDPATFPTAASVLAAGCRLLTPEVALLLAGFPDVRDDVSSFLGCDGPVLLSALTPFARLATITSFETGIQLGTADPWRVHSADRFVAVTG